jgi:enamine deaminase RidA (YjgF/YER057c/UK114 family)
LQHEGDAYGQTKVTLENVIASALAQVGYSLSDVVRSRIYLSNAEDMDAVGKAHGEIFGEIRPAATMLAGIKFINPKMLVEIEVDAWKRAN